MEVGWIKGAVQNNVYFRDWVLSSPDLTIAAFDLPEIPGPRSLSLYGTPTTTATIDT